MRKASEIKKLEVLHSASTLSLKVNKLFNTLRELDLINENALKDVDLNLVVSGPIEANDLIPLNNIMFLGMNKDILKSASLSFAVAKDVKEGKYVYLRLHSILSYISYDKHLAEKLFAEIIEVEKSYEQYMETFNRFSMLNKHVDSFNSAIAHNLNLTEVTSIQKEELVTTERKNESNYENCFLIK